jgi:ATP-dependent helicase HrpB
MAYPLPPRLSSVLWAAAALGEADYGTACAMTAILEGPMEKRKDRTVDLEKEAAGLVAGEIEDLPRETVEIFNQLRSLYHKHPARGSQHPTLHACWLSAYADRLACRAGGAGQVYELGDGRRALLPLGKKAEMPRLVLALDIHETAGAGQNRQITIPVYLSCEPPLVERMFPGECAWTEVSEWDEKRRKVLKEERLMFRGLALGSRQAKQDRQDRRESAELWAEKLASGEVRLPSYDEKVEQLAVRIRLAARYYPDYGFPAMNTDDWRLVYGEISQGRNSIEEIGKADLYRQVCAYLGPALSEFLEKTLPSRVRMRSGKFGRLTYSEAQAPELSARLGDLIGFKQDFSLCEGRLPVVYDILAPNYRTVQKTHDLASFWKNAYPAIKKELQRKYPRHPWP